MRGQDNKAYYNQDPTNYSTPTEVLIGNVVNETITHSGEEISGANRASPWGSSDVGTNRLSGEITYEVERGTSYDETLLMFRSALVNNSVIDMFFLDGEFATGSGWRAPMKIVDNPRTNDLDSKVEVTISLRSDRWNDNGTYREPEGWAAGSTVPFS